MQELYWVMLSGANLQGSKGGRLGLRGEMGGNTVRMVASGDPTESLGAGMAPPEMSSTEAKGLWISTSTSS